MILVFDEDGPLVRRRGLGVNGRSSSKALINRVFSREPICVIWVACKLGLSLRMDLFAVLKREKGIWWMPWYREAMKDVAPCEKLRGDGSNL